MDAATRRQYRLVLTAALLFAFVTGSEARAAATGTQVGPHKDAVLAVLQAPGTPQSSDVSDPPKYPVFGLSLGLAGFPTSYKNVEGAFHQIEAAYADQGIRLDPASPVQTIPTVIPTLRLQINPWLEVALQAGRTESEGNKFGFTGGLVTGRYALPTAYAVSLFGGLGAGKYGFRFQRDYGTVISTDSGGGYTTLDDIVLSGGGPYWSGAAGVSIRPDPHVAIEGLFQYFGMNDESTSVQPGGEIFVNLSGAMVGGSFSYFF